MLTQLSFKNFKAWKTSGRLRLAPITLLFGSNSAGKTSIPQLLLLLKQTAESPDRQRILQLGDARTPVDLGTYEDAVHNHDTDQPLEFSLEWTLEDELTIVDPISDRRYIGEKLGFEASVRVDKRRQPIVDHLSYSLIHGNNVTLDLRFQRRTADNKFDLNSTRYNLVRHPDRAWPLPAPVRFYGFPDEVIAYYQNTAFTSDLVLRLEQMLRSMFYVGPLREYPKRLYLWSGEVPDHVGVKGDRAIEAILAAGDRSFNWRVGQKKKPLATVVADRLQSMGLIRDFQVKPLGAHRKEYEVLVRTTGRQPEVKLTDVGFGVSQVLPVIVEGFYVPRRSVVIFEQPEIHLHPSVQADLADLYVDAIRAREDAVSRDCQFIIESHSEHLLRRLQRRIAEEEISQEDAAIYFVHTVDGAAHIEELKLDKYGNIKNWPDGFFGDEMEDLVARTEAQSKRMSKRHGRQRCE